MGTQSFWDRINRPVDCASLALFRVSIGVMLVWECTYRHNVFGPIDSYTFRFHYPFLGWLPSYPDYNYSFRIVLIILGIAIAVGLLARIAALLAAILFTYGYLLHPEYYLNHLYLLILFLLLLAATRCDREYSLDRLLFKYEDGPNIPYLDLFLLKWQIEVFLIYAGLVKINSDWLHQMPLRHWLLSDGSLFYAELLKYDWLIAAANYGAIALHIVCAPLLFFKRTRLPVFILYCVFHITNHFTFLIGIFPWMTIAASTLFFAPDWPRRVGALLRRSSVAASGPERQVTRRRSVAFATFCAVWLTAQILIPLRHYAYPGDVGWTYEAHRFSWRMKLVDRRSYRFAAVVHVPEQGEVFVVIMRDFLGRLQVQEAAVTPDLTRQAARQLADVFRQELEVADVRVHIYSEVHYNFRPAKFLVDPTVDLAATRETLWPASWLLRENNETPMTYEAWRARDAEDLAFGDILQATGFGSYTRCRESLIAEKKVVKCKDSMP